MYIILSENISCILFEFVRRTKRRKDTIAVGPQENKKKNKQKKKNHKKKKKKNKQKNKKNKKPKWRFFYFAQRAPKLRYYGDGIHSFYWKSAIEHMVVFKMRDSVPSARYSPYAMYCVNGKPRSSLLKEFTDSMIYKNYVYTCGMSLPYHRFHKTIASAHVHGSSRYSVHQVLKQYT